MKYLGSIYESCEIYGLKSLWLRDHFIILNGSVIASL